MIKKIHLFERLTEDCLANGFFPSINSKILSSFRFPYSLHPSSLIAETNSSKERPVLAAEPPVLKRASI